MLYRGTLRSEVSLEMFNFTNRFGGESGRRVIFGTVLSECEERSGGNPENSTH